MAGNIEFIAIRTGKKIHGHISAASSFLNSKFFEAGLIGRREFTTKQYVESLLIEITKPADIKSPGRLGAKRRT